jgi:hypothetical protein
VVLVEIRVNGELKATCGASDLRQLIAMIAVTRSASNGDSSFRVECTGIRSVDASTDEVLKWVNARIQVGDDVSFRLVEGDSAQDPIDRQKITARGQGRDA